MSSSLAAEKPAFGSRAKMILSVFTCIGVGSCCSSIVFLILLAAFKGMIQEDIKNVEWVWRLLLGLGISLYIALHMFRPAVAYGVT